MYLYFYCQLPSSTVRNWRKRDSFFRKIKLYCRMRALLSLNCVLNQNWRQKKDYQKYLKNPTFFFEITQKTPVKMGLLKKKHEIPKSETNAPRQLKWKKRYYTMFFLEKSNWPDKSILQIFWRILINILVGKNGMICANHYNGSIYQT